VRAIKATDPTILVETLVPDFRGDPEAIRTVLGGGQEVFDHNVETVPRLQATVRDPRANYEQSLFVLRHAKEVRPDVYTKSSIMLGLGETRNEVIDTLRDLRAADVDIVTLGQYLRPSAWHLAVNEYVSPESFEWYRRQAEDLGFLYVASGPLVRSSYRAGEFFLESMLRQRRVPP
jgi:lipoic acid synthetase